MQTDAEPGRSSVPHLLDAARSGLTTMQELQREYDNAMWDIEDPPHSKMRHIQIHLSSAVGRIADLIEPGDHRSHHGAAVDVRSLKADLAPVLADLLMHAAQLANLVDADLGEALAARYRANASRFAPGSALARP